MALNRTEISQYYGIDPELKSDDAITKSQSAGIGVGSKIKGFGTADPENGVDSYIIDAYDIDWTGYKINGNAVRSTGEVIEAMAGTSGEEGWPWAKINEDGELK